jgi:hypothetical protein
LLKEIRDAGRVPLGVVSYDVEREEFVLSMCPDVSWEELNALLEKLRLRFKVTP